MTNTKNIELNNTNCIDCDSADLIFDAIIASADNEKITLEDDVKKLHKLDSLASKAEYKSEVYYATQKKLHAAKVEFVSKYGENALVKFVIYKTLGNRLLSVLGAKVAPKLSKTKFSKFD